MIKKFYFFMTIYLMKSSYCFSQEQQTTDFLFNRAQTYFEAKNYSQALLIFENMQSMNLPKWAQSIITYNIGTIYLTLGQWDKAIDQFHTISLDNDPFPLLTRQVETNTGLAYLNKMLAMKSKLQSIQIHQMDDYFQLSYLLSTALNHFNEAIKRDCRLEKVEGALECTRPLDLKEMLRLIQWFNTELINLKRDYLKSELDFNKKVFLLINGLSTLQSNLEILQNPQASQEVISQYSALFLERSQELIPLWQQNKEISVNNSLNDLFQKAEQNFLKAIEDLKNNQLTSSLAQLSLSLNQLLGLQQLVPQSSLTENNLKQLLFIYQLIISEDSFDESLLKLLYKQQQTLIPTLEESPQKKTLSFSFERLKEALYWVKKGSTSLTRLFFIDAMYWLENTIRETGNIQTPTTILKNALDDQRHVVILQRNAELVKEIEAEESIQKLMTTAQKQAELTALPFSQTVFALQKQIFDSSSSDDPGCQKNPWNEVFPLFNKGLEDVMKINQTLANTRYQSFISLQESVLQNWQKAYDILIHGISSSEEKKAENKSQESHKQNKSSEPPSSSLTQVIRQLQEMELNDQALKSKPLPIKQGERPW